MVSKFRRTLSKLRANTSGNATMLVAIGIPALIGGSGLAVDTAQWYMWKKELQYAVDQAALAGAWAKTNEDTADHYSERAEQEYDDNLGIISDFATDPTIRLANYSGGSNNSVVVSAQATKRLPFSSFLTNHATTVAATATASFDEGRAFTACLFAVNEHDSGAVTIGGSAGLAARCGIAALSDSPSAIVINGNPDVDPGWVVARGGIDNWFDTHPDTEVHENVSNLFDPFAELTPPNDPRPRTYACSKGTSSSTTTGTEVITLTTNIYKGNKKNSVTLFSTSTGAPTTVPVDRPTMASDIQGTSTSSSTSSTTADLGNRANPRYVQTEVITQTVKNYTITVSETVAGAVLSPGTYSKGIRITCNTVFQPGIYVIDGGDLDLTGQDTVQGNGVMFVLTNGAGIQVRGGSSINLTAMDATQLQAAYSVPTITAANAERLDGMLVFEDPDSEGVSQNHNVINGNASTVLNGTIYLPVSEIRFQGNASVTNRCLMIVANKITLQGNVSMESFCPAGMVSDTEISSSSGRVRLVA